jgi:hypothetical protein
VGAVASIKKPPFGHAVRGLRVSAVSAIIHAHGSGSLSAWVISAGTRVLRLAATIDADVHVIDGLAQGRPHAANVAATAPLKDGARSAEGAGESGFACPSAKYSRR